MNKCYITGRLTADPSFTTATNGLSVCKFTVAVDRQYKNDEEKIADFIPVVTFKATADNCAKFIKKGSKILVEGSIQTRSYDANDGSKRYVTEIIAQNVEFLDSKPKTEVKTEASAKQEIMQNFEPISEDNLPF